MNKKYEQLVSGIILLVLGILVAIFGGQTILDTYFAVISIIAGAALLALAVVSIAKKVQLAPALPIVGGALLAIGIGLFTDWLSMGIVINLAVFAVLGGGCGLVLYSIYLLCRKETQVGLTNLIVGVLAVTLGALYIAVPDFRKIFWIIVGVVIAVYGFVEMVFAISALRRK